MLIAAIAGLGVVKLEVDTGTSTFLDRSDPAWATYQKSLREYGGDEVVVVALEGNRAYDPEILKEILRLSSTFEEIPGVRRVDSIASVPVIFATADGSLSLEPALRDGFGNTLREFRDLSDRLRIDRIAPRILVSDDEHVFAINLFLDEDIDRGRDVVVAEVRRILEGTRAWVSGVPVFRTEVNSQTRTELMLFVPLTLLLMGCVVYFACGRLSWVFVSLGTSGIGTWNVLGAMGALGTTLSLSTMILPSILLALGCAYIMHILSAADNARSQLDLENVVLSVARPVGLSGLTTAIGFLAMSTVRIDAIRELGIYGAIGVVSILLASLSVAPSALSLLPKVNEARFRGVRLRRSVDQWLIPFIFRHRKAIISAWFVSLVFFSFGLLRLHVETDIILWFSKGTDVRDAYENIRTRLAGITPVNVVINAEDGGSVVTPEVLSSIHGLANYLEELPAVGRSLSVADPLIQIHNGFNPGSEGDLPRDAKLISQYLLLLGSVEQLQDVLTVDRSGANIVLRLNDNGSSRIVGIAQDVDRWWEEHGPPGFSATTTGVMYEFGRAEEEIAYGQIRGLGFALLAIGIILFLIFRRPKIAISALIPNLIPLVVAYGFMGIIRVPLDAATICLGSLALGIAVDDTIHVTSRFAAWRGQGLTDRDALAESIRRVLPALTFSTIAIAVGFGVVGLSDFTLIRNLGLVTSAMVVICLLADLTLLPALLAPNPRGDRLADRIGA
jgi:predicted RND superfamily exporter protein